MKIAVVHPYPVHAGAVGGTTRVHALVHHLAKRHEVHVLTHASLDRAADEAAISEMAAAGIDLRTFPRPRVTIARKARWVVDRAPYVVSHNRNPALEAALRRLDAERGLDVVHSEFAYLAPVVAGVGPAVARVLAEQETLSLAVERLRRVPVRLRSPFQWYAPYEIGKVRRFEAVAVRDFDRVFATNEIEAARYRHCGARAVAVLPHVVAVRTFRPPEQEPTDERVLFVGNFAHAPNRDAVTWLVKAIWPRVRAVAPRATLEVIGPALPSEDERRIRRAGGTTLAWADDLPSCYGRAAVFVNPIRTGAGMRGKVLEAFACGRAVVSTRLGMEGIKAGDGQHFDSADDPSKFAHAIVNLLGDPARRRALGRTARELVVRSYDAPVVLARLEDEYEAAVRDRRMAGGMRGVA